MLGVPTSHPSPAGEGPLAWPPWEGRVWRSRRPPAAPGSRGCRNLEQRMWPVFFLRTGARPSVCSPCPQHSPLPSQNYNRQPRPQGRAQRALTPARLGDGLADIIPSSLPHVVAGDTEAQRAVCLPPAPQPLQDRQGPGGGSWHSAVGTALMAPGSEQRPPHSLGEGYRTVGAPVMAHGWQTQLTGLAGHVPLHSPLPRHTPLDCLLHGAGWVWGAALGDSGDRGGRHRPPTSTFANRNPAAAIFTLHSPPLAWGSPLQPPPPHQPGATSLSFRT